MEREALVFHNEDVTVTTALLKTGQYATIVQHFQYANNEPLIVHRCSTEEEAVIVHNQWVGRMMYGRLLPEIIYILTPLEDEMFKAEISIIYRDKEAV